MAEMKVSEFSFSFEKKCLKYEESTGDKRFTDTVLKGTQVAFDTGNSWEERVYKRIEAGEYSFAEGSGERLTIGDGTKKGPCFILDKISSFIKDPDMSVLYLKQVRLEPGNGFISDKDRFLGSLMADLGNSLKPGDADLIYLWKDGDGTCVISICDIKAALTVKLYHKIQVEIYYEFLESYLEDKDLPGRYRIDDSGYIWTRDVSRPDAFKREPIHNFLKDNFSMKKDDPDDADSALPDDVRYMNPQRCEGCIHIDECIANVKKNKMDLILTPGMNERDVMFLAKNADLATAEGIREYVSDDAGEGEDKPRLKMCTFFQKLCYNPDHMENFIKLRSSSNTDLTGYAMKDRVIHPDLPVMKAEDVQIYMSAQYEQYSNSVPVLALGIKEGDADIDIDLYIADVIEKQPGEENLIDITDNLGRFARRLADVLRHVSDEGLNLQGYVEDGIERHNLEKVLFEYASREDTGDQLKKDITVILMWLRSEKTLGYAPNVGELGGNITRSLLTVTEIADTLYYFPSYLSTDLEEIARCFDLTVSFKSPEIFNRFNGNVKNTFLYEMYILKGDREAMKTALGKALTGKLRTEQKVIDKIRSDKRAELTNKAPYTYNDSDEYIKNYVLDNRKHLILPPEDQIFESGDIGRINYMVDYEEYIAKRQIRAPRLRGMREGISRKQFFELEYVGAIPKEGGNINIKGRTMSIRKPEGSRKKYILAWAVPETEDKTKGGLKHRRTAKDVKNDESVYVFKVLHNRHKLYKNPVIVNRKDFDVVPMWNGGLDDADRHARIFNIKGKFTWIEKINRDGERIRTEYVTVSGIDWKKEAGGIVFDSYCDVTSNSLVEFLYHLEGDGGRRQRAWDLLGAETDAPLPEGYIETPFFREDEEKDKNKQDAFNMLNEREVSAVIGPPGTGKTFFIARALLKFIAQNSSRPLRILLTSNSWAAIENMKGQLDSQISDPRNEHVSYVTVMLNEPRKKDEREELVDTINTLPSPVVIGSTVWQINNLCNRIPDGADEPECKDLAFDLVVIDEATQVRLCDSLIALSRIKEDGKLLIVGDDDQLGSIIMGKYEIPDGRDDIYGSVFSWFYRKFSSMEHGPVTQLNQCRRMNEVLTRYLADKLYGSSYETVPDKRLGALRLDPGYVSDDLTGFIADPDYQFTVCYMEGGEDAIYDLKQAERSLVAELAILMQKAIRTDTGSVDFAGLWGTDRVAEGDEEDEGGFTNADAAGMLGIITPYNLLNEEITDTIADKYFRLPDDEKVRLGIGGKDTGTISEYIKCSTVDKFQGQERDVIISCYGEKNLNNLMFIKDFVYNSNRLNVVISRAKKKCIIILSDLMARRYQECYEGGDEKVVKGVEFMCGLKPYLTRDDEPDDYGMYIRRDQVFDYSYEEDGADKTVKLHVYQKGYVPKTDV